LAEKKSTHHDEFMELHMFKEEYIAKLEAIGIESPKELAAALKDVEKTKEIHENLKGAGPKTIEHWKEDLKVRAEPKAEKKEEEKPAPKTRKVKTAPKKASEEKETKKEAKEEKEPEEPVKKKGEKEEEEVEIEEEGGYQVKLKPKLSKETIDALKKRAEVDARRPEFLRQEWHRRKRLQTAKWRRPRGGHSKMRQHYGYRPPVVSIGYGSPREARFLHPSGFREVMVYNVKDLAKIRPEQEAARVAHSVGMKKRLEIEKKAEELKIRVLNRSG
jgi:large subunit ribosomal protein L32e